MLGKMGLWRPSRGAHLHHFGELFDGSAGSINLRSSCHHCHDLATWLKQPFVVRSRSRFPVEPREANPIRVSWLPSSASFPRSLASARGLTQRAEVEPMFLAPLRASNRLQTSE